MGVEVRQGKRDASVAGPTSVAASEIGPTTYAEGGVVRQETWEFYQPEVAAEMKSAAARAEAKQVDQAPEVVSRADGGRPFADRGHAPARATNATAADDEQGSAITDENPVGSTTKAAVKAGRVKGTK